MSPCAGPTLVEICVDDLDGAVVADRCGVDRIELCANLAEGGTTPSIGTVVAVLHSVQNVSVQVIVRPRGGDFVYSDDELSVMCRDLEAINRAAAETSTVVGVVLGALTPLGEVDAEAMHRLIAAAGALPVTFHRAFDETRDLLAAYETMITLGIERVLTAGGPSSAVEGIEMLAELVQRSHSADGRPAVLVGGSVRPPNVRKILLETGAREIHLRAQRSSERGDGTWSTDETIIRDLLSELQKPIQANPLPSVALQNAGQNAVVIALDIGGTSFKGAVVDTSGRALDVREVGVGQTGTDSVRLIVELLKNLRANTELLGNTVIGIGVVTPGMVDADSGTVRYASTLDWTNLPLGPMLSTELGLPVQLGHDVRSSGLAESLFGASAGVSHSVLVAIGTGVAASILSDDHPVVGAITTAGELGHIAVIPDGEACTCGQVGCLEVYFSGAGLARRYVAYGGEVGIDAEGICQRLGTDSIADRVWSEGVHALALGLKSITLLIDPAVIVLAGGVSRAGEKLLTPLRAEFGTSLVWRDAPEIRISKLATSGGRIGAAVLAFRAGRLGHIVDRWSIDDLIAEPDVR